MDNLLRCIIVDDEEGAHLVLGHYLKLLQNIELKASFFNAIEAMTYLYEHPVDVMFLDINMPGLSGMEMLQAMSNPPLIVLTTAYKEFALESYKYRVVDYLVKPFDFPRFMAAMDNVFSRFTPRRVQEAKQPNEKPAQVSVYLMLKVDGNIVKLTLDHVTHIQSWGNYVKVYTDQTTYISPVTTTEMELKLDRKRFLRIHKSFIVGLQHISKITGGQVELNDGTVLPIGNTYRRELLEHFQ